MACESQRNLQIFLGLLRFCLVMVLLFYLTGHTHIVVRCIVQCFHNIEARGSSSLTFPLSLALQVTLGEWAEGGENEGAGFRRVENQQEIFVPGMMMTLQQVSNSPRSDTLGRCQ